ncbi:hypothetical protein Tco_0715614 [Tanacetum coccineum]
MPCSYDRRGMWDRRVSIEQTSNANSGLSILEPLMELIIEHCTRKCNHSISNEMVSVPELLHKYFRNFSKNGECLVVGRVLYDIDDNLKGFFLLWHNSLQSYIGGTDLDFFLSGNPLFITSSNLTNFYLIHDSS